MVLYQVYSDVVERTYRAHVCSFATLFNIGIGVLTFLGPLFVAYYSIGLWLMEDNYREQPEVSYKHEFILTVQGAQSSSLLGYSTYSRFNTLLGESKLRIPTVKSAEFDRNYDGKMDYLTLQITFPLKTTEVVHNVRLLLFFNYNLYKFASVQMQAMANVYHDSAVPGTVLLTEGYLKLVQKHQFPHKGSYTKFNSPIVDAESDSFKSWDIHRILAAYQARNVSTDFIARYPVWKSGETYGNPFTIIVKVFYPEEVILYRPGVWQFLKFAWVQYVSILALFFVILRQVKRFVYSNRLVRVLKPKVHID